MNKSLKSIVLFMMLLLSFGCKTPIKKDSSFIYGKWTIVRYRGRTGNVMPKIEFKKNGKGKITGQTKDIVGFSFELDTDNNMIMFSFDGEHTKIYENELYYKKFKKNNSERLELITRDGKYNYILAKSKYN